MQNSELYVLQGIDPTPSFEYKLNTSHVRKIYENNFVYQFFVPNEVRRHRHFKYCLDAQDPGIDSPTRANLPSLRCKI